MQNVVIVDEIELPVNSSIEVNAGGKRNRWKARSCMEAVTKTGTAKDQNPYFTNTIQIFRYLS